MGWEGIGRAMLISKLGEFGLIERIKRSIKTDSSVVKGVGDDCAVLKFNKDSYLLLTSDMIVEGVDFTRAFDPFLIGRKALAVSISDIAACAGIPRYCLVSLAIPENTSVGYADRIFKGILGIAKEYNINIVGGDISGAKQIAIDVSILGFVEKKYLALRSKAKIGDMIFVTGSLGGSILGKHLKFRPRIKEARFLSKNFKVNSMIDISDGLLQDLGHILKESNVGAVIYEGLIPISKQARNLNDALYMGEDFELLFSVPQNEAKKILKNNRYNFKLIGEIVGNKYGLKLIDKSARAKQIKPKGFQHF